MQELINVLKNIKRQADSKIAASGTMVFMSTGNFNKAKEHCIRLRETMPLSQLANKSETPSLIAMFKMF